MNIRDAINAVAGPDVADLDAATAEVFDALGVPNRWRETFWTLVRDDVRRRCRICVTHPQFDDTGHSPTETQAPFAGVVVPSRTAYLADRIYCGEPWGYVRYGAMTVAQHEARIAFQQSLVAGIDRDIEKHRLAVKQITDAGVSCLDEIEVAA